MIRSVPARGAAAVAITALTLLALTGCGDDDSGSAATGNDSGASTEVAPETETETETVAEEEESEDAAAEDEEPILSGEACLYGNWYLDNESFKAMLEEAGGNVLSVTGWAIVWYGDDGTTMATFDEWTTVTTEDNAETTMVRNGEDLATYEVTGDTITTRETEGNSVLEMTMKMDGQDAATVVAPHEPSVTTVATFTCEGETLTVTAEGATSVLHREH